MRIFEKGKHDVSLFFVVFQAQSTNCLFRCKVRIAFSCANLNYIFRCKHKLSFHAQAQIVFLTQSPNYLSGANTNCLFVCKHKLHFQVLIKNFLSVKCKLPFRCKVRIAFSCANLNYIFRCKHKLSFHAQAQIVFLTQITNFLFRY